MKCSICKSPYHKDPQCSRAPGAKEARAAALKALFDAPRRGNDPAYEEQMRAMLELREVMGEPHRQSILDWRVQHTLRVLDPDAADSPPA